MLKPDGSFFRVDFGDGGYTLIDQNATDTTTVTMYHTYFNQRNRLIGTGRVLTVPCATEGNWAFRGVFAGAADPTPVCDGSPGDILNGIVLTDNVIFYAPMVLGPGNPNTWYFGTDKLYRSVDRADTATVASQLLDPILPPGVPPLGGSIASIGVAPQDDNVRLVGMAGSGKIFATTTGSPTLLQIAGQGATNGPATGTPNVAVNRIAVDPNNKDIAYVAYNGFGTAVAPLQHVYKISNLNALSATPPGQVTFTAMSNGLPDVPANALAIDPLRKSGTPASSTELYVGTDAAVYFSPDGGASWAPYGTGFPHVTTFGLEIQNPNRVVRAATHGRGLYEIAANASPTPTPTSHHHHPHH